MTNQGKMDVGKKAKAMYLIRDEWATLVELLGCGNKVYLEFQMAMLKQDRERRIMVL